MCSVFRTYQGWTALTPQGPGDGTLQLVPIAKGMMYLLLRPLLEDYGPGKAALTKALDETAHSSVVASCRAGEQRQVRIRITLILMRVPVDDSNVARQAIEIADVIIATPGMQIRMTHVETETDRADCVSKW